MSAETAGDVPTGAPVTTSSAAVSDAPIDTTVDTMIEALADDAWLIRLGETIDPAINARVHRLTARLRAEAPPWLRVLTPAYASLAVFFDDGHTDADTVLRELRAALDAEATASARTTSDAAASDNDASSRIVEIPVAYGEAFGADFSAAAAELGLSAQALVERHSGAEYRVAMLGFAPGFPYLLGLDPALALPRLSTPRTRVPAGSVAIGGAQTGIYPRESPGGWRLIGRTPLRLFDPARAQPSLLTPGDRVRFRPIDADAFARMTAASPEASIG